MRISDWSSDVCSSDLGHERHDWKRKIRFQPLAASPLKRRNISVELSPRKRAKVSRRQSLASASRSSRNDGSKCNMASHYETALTAARTPHASIARLIAILFIHRTGDGILANGGATAWTKAINRLAGT